MGKSNYVRQQHTNHAYVDFKLDFWICDGLWNADAGSIDHYHSYGNRVLCFAETLC